MCNESRPATPPNDDDPLVARATVEAPPAASEAPDTNPKPPSEGADHV